MAIVLLLTLAARLRRRLLFSTLFPKPVAAADRTFVHPRNADAGYFLAVDLTHQREAGRAALANSGLTVTRNLHHGWLHLQRRPARGLRSEAFGIFFGSVH